MKVLSALLVLVSSTMSFASKDSMVFHETCEISASKSSLSLGFVHLDLSPEARESYQEDLMIRLQEQGYTVTNEVRPNQIPVKVEIDAYVKNNKIYPSWTGSVLVAGELYELAPGKRFYEHFNGFNRAKKQVLKLIPKCVVR